MMEFLRERISTNLSEEQENHLRSALSTQYVPVFGSVNAKLKGLLNGSAKEASSFQGDLFLSKNLSGKTQNFFYYLKIASGLEIGSFSSEEVSADHNVFAQTVLASLGTDAQRRRVSSLNPTFSSLFQEWGGFSIPEGEHLAARLLFDLKVRSWFKDLIKSERKQWTGSNEDVPRDILDQMEKQGMLKSQFSIFCSSTGNQMMMVESLEAIEEAAKQGFKCFVCGRSFSEEKQVRFVNPTPFGKRIAIPNYWLVLQTYESLWPFLSKDKISVIFEKNSATLFANVETSLLLFEIKDAPYQLQDAFLFAQKIMLYNPAASCVFATGGINAEVAQYLESALPEHFYRSVNSNEQLTDALPLLLEKAYRRHLREILSPFTQLSVTPVDLYALSYLFSEDTISIPGPQTADIMPLPAIEEVVPAAPEPQPLKTEKMDEILETLPSEILEFEPRDTILHKSSKSAALEKILLELGKGGAGRESSLHILLQDLNDADKRSKACLVSQDGLVIASTLQEEISEMFASYGTEFFSKAKSIVEQTKFFPIQRLFASSENFSLQIYPVSEFYLIVTTTLETVVTEPLPETSLPEGLKQVCDHLLEKRGIEGVEILDSEGSSLCQAGLQSANKTFFLPNFLSVFSELAPRFTQVGQGNLKCLGIRADSEQEALFQTERGHLLTQINSEHPFEDIVPEVLPITQDISRFLKSAVL